MRNKIEIKADFGHVFEALEKLQTGLTKLAATYNVAPSPLEVLSVAPSSVMVQSISMQAGSIAQAIALVKQDIGKVITNARERT